MMMPADADPDPDPDPDPDWHKNDAEPHADPTPKFHTLVTGLPFYEVSFFSSVSKMSST